MGGALGHFFFQQAGGFADFRDHGVEGFGKLADFVAASHRYGDAEVAALRFFRQPGQFGNRLHQRARHKNSEDNGDDEANQADDRGGLDDGERGGQAFVQVLADDDNPAQVVDVGRAAVGEDEGLGDHALLRLELPDAPLRAEHGLPFTLGNPGFHA